MFQIRGSPAKSGAVGSYAHAYVQNLKVGSNLRERHFAYTGPPICNSTLRAGRG